MSTQVLAVGTCQERSRNLLNNTLGHNTADRRAVRCAGSCACQWVCGLCWQLLRRRPEEGYSSQGKDCTYDGYTVLTGLRALCASGGHTVVRQGVQDVQGAARKEGIEEGTAANGKECPCDQSAAYRAPPAQRAWVAFISPCLLLFAMCIHGIFEGLALGIQVRLQDSTLPVALVPHRSAACLQSGISEAHRTENSVSG